MSWSNERIQELIGCPKQVADPPKREMKLVNGSRRNDFTLRSVDQEHEFVAFMRVNERFPENFSIGLDYVPKAEKGRITLLRCNGDHGFHQNHVRDQAYFGGHHVHLATQEAIDAELDPDDFAEVTDAYATYEAALLHFLKLTNVIDVSNHFSTIMKQLRLFEEAGQG
ncbi:MAG: hypothetical protein HY692_01550 [Cyanobacteria bacterium NC_groundwater_1444_Ag_S-0.65um_54_12]|nr:hypothetical protein [Cyanobacteria bacterium NC_groundwater_1444_Ag_S-0.65um_54_12]